MQNLEEAIRERAYHLWIAAGRPDGNSDAYWLDAQRELLTLSIETIGSAPATAKPAKKAKAVRAKKPAKRSAA